MSLIVAEGDALSPAVRPMPSAGWSDRLAAMALALYSLGALSLLVLAGVRLLPGDQPWQQWRAAQWATVQMNSVGLMYDDGFYYFKIAQQIANGMGSTFDGMHMTNGYHPLWLLCLVPVFWLTSAPDSALVLGTLLQGLFVSLGVALCYHTARLMLGRFASSLAALLWLRLQLTYHLALSGMEFSLHALCIMATVYVYLRWWGAGEQPSRQRYLQLGLLLGLSFLARLDTILLAGVLGLALAWHDLRQGFTRAAGMRLLALGLPVLMVCVLYAGINLWLFGEPLPVSGVVKRGWSARLLELDPSYQAYGWLVAKLRYLFWPLGHQQRLFVLTLALGTVGWGIVDCGLSIAVSTLFPRGRAWFSRTLRPLRPFGLYSLLHLLSFVLLYHGGFSFQPWYYVIQPLLALLLIAIGADALWRMIGQIGWPGLRRLAGPALALCWLVVPLSTARLIGQWHTNDRLAASREPLYAAAGWVASHVPAGAIVGSWNAGMIGYLSGRQVVNLDGLVNSWHYYRVEQYDLCRYWQENNISYLVDVFETKRELDFIKAYYAPYADLTACSDAIKLVWVGPGYPNSPRHAEALLRESERAILNTDIPRATHDQ